MVYRYYPYSPLATLLSLLTTLGAVLAAVIGVVLLSDKHIVVGVLLIALGVFLYCYVELKVIDGLGQKWSAENIRTKPATAFRYCRQHPEAFEQLCAENPAFAEEYERNEKGKVVKKCT